MRKLIMAGVAGFAGLAIAGPVTPAFASASAPASTPACAQGSSPNCYGAIAVGKSNYGISTQAGSQSQAEKDSLSACAQNTTDCKVLGTNKNGWFAMAQGTNNVSAAFGDVGTSQQAKDAVENAAVKACNDKGGTGCRVVAVANSITGSSTPSK